MVGRKRLEDGGGNPGLVVVGGDSCSIGRGFESKFLVRQKRLQGRFSYFKKGFYNIDPLLRFEEKNSGDPKFGSPYCDENRKKIHNFLPLFFLPRKGGNIF